ncbi:SMI1/KNR4 family protein [Prevotella jejuni]
MNTEENNRQITELAQRLNMKFPSSYVDFLSEIDNGDVF